MASVTTSRTPSATTDLNRLSRGARARALFISADFIAGVLFGAGIALLPTLVPALIPNGFAFFISLAGISAAIAALVLSPMALLISALTPGLARLLKSAPGGPAETFVPFAQVAAIAAVACASSIIVAILTPLAELTYPVVIWVCVAIPVGLFVWALVGCVQVTFYLIEMFRTSHKIEMLEARTQAAREIRAQRDGTSTH
jgi:F0F1-type ATP synthase assembly protein I